MREIARILCGSQLYGTADRKSDRDFKIVYIPSGDDILLQRGYHHFSPEQRTKAEASLQAQLKDPGGKMDIEYLTVQKFIELLCAGHANAWDMIFAPKTAFIGPAEPEWYAIWNNAGTFMSNAMGGNYLSAPRNWIQRVASAPGMVPGPYAGNEWKDAYHVIRVMSQYIELMKTGKLVFPREERMFLKAIRRGLVPFPSIQKHANFLWGRAVTAGGSCGFGIAPDLDRAEQLVKTIYKGELFRQPDSQEEDSG